MSVTIKDVARKANVGVSTVSRAMNQTGYVSVEALERIKSAVEELGYKPDPTARALIRRKVDMVALVVDCPLNETWDRIITHLENELFVEKYISCVFIISDEMDDWHQRYRTVMEMIRERRMSGIIFMGGDVHARDEELYQSLLNENIPMVGIECYMPGSVVVSSDQEAAGRIATRHLLSLGHKRIGHVRPLDDGAAAGRLTGWKKELGKAGITPDERWEVKVSGPGFQPARELGLQVLAQPDRPTAYICCNDEAALGLMSAANELGIKVPGELSIIGYDNMPSSAMYNPPLTTLVQPTERMARIAVDELMTSLHGRDVVVGKRIVETSLVVRGTTAPPPAK